MNDEDIEVIILDEDDEMDDVRNARVVSRSGGSRSRSRGRSGRRISGRSGRGRRSSGPRRGRSGELVRQDGELSTGKLVEAGAQILAAIQPLPSAPVATGKLETDLANMVLYQKALAEHAKRDEQLRTVGSLGAKLFA